MSSAVDDFPDYARPPVVETVLGLQFERIVRMTSAHFGAFWRSLDAASWPIAADAPWLPSQFEQFETRIAWSRGLQFRMTQESMNRVQIRNESSDRMLQLQNTRLHYNWIMGRDGVYPRYDMIRAEFWDIFARFRDFLAAEQLEPIVPNQWEVTYVNRIPRGSVWNDPSEWDFFRPLGACLSVPQIIEAETFGGEWHYMIPGERGRLHVSWQHGLDETDGASIRLTFTARGSVNNDARDEELLAGLDLGRATIVRAFRELMSDRANAFWGLKS